MDGIPLGDQSYGNYNGLSPQRAVISENVGRVVVSTGAGDLATASNSNLGGTVETFSSSPLDKFGIQAAQTFGSYDTSRTFVRIDTGTFGRNGTTSAYISAARQHARAWDFNGKQGGYQANAKFVHDGKIGKLTALFRLQRHDPAERGRHRLLQALGRRHRDARSSSTRPTPSRSSIRISAGTGPSYMTALGNSPAAEGSNYRNYYSDAQRTDYLGYLRYDATSLRQYHLVDHGAITTTMTAPASSPARSASRSPPPSPISTRTMRPCRANCRFGANGNGIRPSTGPTLHGADRRPGGRGGCRAGGRRPAARA